MKSIYRTIIAAAGSFLAAQFGGWDAALETLVCFMAIDWITGGVLLPVVLKRVRNLKTEHWRAVRDGKDFAEKV